MRRHRTVAAVSRKPPESKHERKESRPQLSRLSFFFRTALGTFGCNHHGRCLIGIIRSCYQRIGGLVA
jgi:hypothetical protein